MGNLGGIEAVEEPWHGRPASATITLPPLGVLWLTPETVEAAEVPEATEAAEAPEISDASDASEASASTAAADDDAPAASPATS
jgi:hypothetical protein